MNPLLEIAQRACMPDTPSLPDLQPGDTVKVHLKVREKNKERLQYFQGVVLQVRGDTWANRTFTVRKVADGIGVERIFPLLMPSLTKVEVLERARVRRARLFYLRKLRGKAAKLKRA